MRKFWLIIGAVAALLTVATPADAASATISARLTKTSVQVGTTLYVEGTVTPAWATPRVVLQRAIDGRWVDRDAATVDRSTGRFRIAVKPSQVGTYSLRVRSGGGTVASSRLTLKVTAPPVRLTASLSSTSVYVRGTTYVVGRITPVNATPRVVVQRNLYGRWTDVAAGPVDQRKGEFSIPLTPGQVATYTLRVRTNGGSVVSSPMTLRVAARPAPVTPTPPPGPRCDPNYSGCVPIATDVDCAGGGGDGPAYVQGPIMVIGRDVYGLDHDKDGIACER